GLYLAPRLHQGGRNNSTERKDTMKKYISSTIIALLATVAISTAATNDNALQEKENAAWQAFKDKKPDVFKKLVSANMMGVYVEGVSDMQKELADMQKWDMKSFAISDYKVTPAGPDTCVTTYKVAVEGNLQRRVRLEETEGRMAGRLSHQRERGTSWRIDSR
ncbi:MAG: hypothetical protein DMF39_09395, partial [Verrucomicrobia bacterium]